MMAGKGRRYFSATFSCRVAEGPAPRRTYPSTRHLAAAVTRMQAYRRRNDGRPGSFSVEYLNSMEQSTGCPVEGALCVGEVDETHEQGAIHFSLIKSCRHRTANAISTFESREIKPHCFPRRAVYLLSCR